MKILKYQKTLSFILGSLSVLALPPYYLFPVLFLTIPGLIWLLNNQMPHKTINSNKIGFRGADGSKTRSAEAERTLLVRKHSSTGFCNQMPYKTNFALGYLFGFGFYALGFSWVGNALLIDAPRFGWLYPITLAAAGAFFGLFIAIPACLSTYFKPLQAKVLSFAALFVIFEWLRSFILTGFPWNLLGSTLAFNTNLLQPASIIGTYGLSLLVIIIASSPLFYKHSKMAAFGLLMLLPLTYAFGLYRTSALFETPSKLKIRLVQPAIPQSLKWSQDDFEDNFNAYINLSLENGFEDINLVIWGETASPFLLDMDPNRLLQAASAAPKNGYLITGAVRYELDAQNRPEPLNSMFIINNQAQIIGHYDKAHLVPFGEYIPLKKYLPSFVGPIVGSMSNFKAGLKHKTFRLADIPSFGASICYEIIFPSEIINKKDPPDWLINVTNDGWYGQSAGPYQHLAAARLRAVEEGITIIRSANTGISAVISKTGKILAEIPLNRCAVLDFYLPSQPKVSTIYGLFGNLIPLSISILCIILAFILNKKYAKNLHKPKTI